MESKPSRSNESTMQRMISTTVYFAPRPGRLIDTGMAHLYTLTNSEAGMRKTHTSKTEETF